MTRAVVTRKAQTESVEDLLALLARARTEMAHARRCIRLEDASIAEAEAKCAETQAAIMRATGYRYGRPE